jgi:hypothetical protein
MFIGNLNFSIFPKYYFNIKTPRYKYNVNINMPKATMKVDRNQIDVQKTKTHLDLKIR